MSTLTEELIQLIERVDRVTTLPRVQQAIIPPIVSAGQSKYSKFGLLILDDGNAGFFYRLLEQSEWQKIYSTERIKVTLDGLRGVEPASLCHGLGSSDPMARGLGMAAINAISQHVFARAGFQPSAIRRERSTLSAVARPGQAVGMVGYFAPMVEALQAAKVHTTVIELDESLYQQSDSLLVTDDISRLGDCQLVYCTASTLLNDSLESILQQLPHNPRFELIGPTCGCFADPLFARGVDSIGSSTVVDSQAAMEKILSLQPWGQSVSKYEIRPDSYPGFDALLAALDDG